MIPQLNINNRAFIKYKFLNSLFLGISIGTYITIYKPLEMSIYSASGIILALLMIIVAKYYHKILNTYYFYKISLFVELIILALICYFLIFSYSYHTSLLVYIGYQLTFVFGSYLVRAETLILKNSRILTYIDVAKQTGSLVGMGIAFIFYQVFEHNLDINENEDQVYYIHYILLLIEILIIWKLRDSFQKS